MTAPTNVAKNAKYPLQCRGRPHMTAAHVLEECKRARRSGRVISVQLGDGTLDLEDRNSVIAFDKAIDIATFRISEAEVAALGKTVLRGAQRQWPPLPPQPGRGVYFSGFPGIETICTSSREVCFGAAPGGGIASSVSEYDISSQIERKHLLAVLARGLPPENYDFGGMSGGPMLTVVESSFLRSWSLAGVVYQGPNPSPDSSSAIAGLEIIRARRAHFILPDGSLDVQRWNELNATRPARS